MEAAIVIGIIFLILSFVYIKTNPALDFVKFETIGIDAKALSTSIENDNAWKVQNSNFLLNINTGGVIWIHGGVDEVDYYPSVHAFNKRERQKLWKSIKIRIAKNSIFFRGE